jgi:hypothetical protein
MTKKLQEEFLLMTGFSNNGEARREVGCFCFFADLKFAC